MLKGGGGGGVGGAGEPDGGGDVIEFSVEKTSEEHTKNLNEGLRKEAANPLYSNFNISVSASMGRFQSNCTFKRYSLTFNIARRIESSYVNPKHSLKLHIHSVITAHSVSIDTNSLHPPLF